MLHIDEFNQFKDEWYSLLADKYTVVEWSYQKDKYHIGLFHPEIDINLFPATAIRVFAALLKLYDYGGIAVIGLNTKPHHSLVNVESIKSLSIVNQNPNILLSPANDKICLKYLSTVKEDLLKGVWKNVQYLDDVIVL